jgi:hypothetical protein
VHANADAAHVRTYGASDLLSVAVPSFTCEGANGSTLSTLQLRGRLVYILFAQSPSPGRVDELARLNLGPDATKVLVTLDGKSLPTAADLCIARDASVGAVFAGYRGGDPRQLDGTVFVVDAAGFIRGMQRSHAVPSPAMMQEIRERSALPRSTVASMHSH